MQNICLALLSFYLLLLFGSSRNVACITKKKETAPDPRKNKVVAKIYEPATVSRMFSPMGNKKPLGHHFSLFLFGRFFRPQLSRKFLIEGLPSSPVFVFSVRYFYKALHFGCAKNLQSPQFPTPCAFDYRSIILPSALMFPFVITARSEAL